MSVLCSPAAHYDCHQAFAGHLEVNEPVFSVLQLSVDALGHAAAVCRHSPLNSPDLSTRELTLQVQARIEEHVFARTLQDTGQGSRDGAALNKKPISYVLLRTHQPVKWAQGSKEKECG